MGIKLKVTLWYTLLMAILCAFALLAVNRYVAHFEQDDLNDSLRSAVALGALGAEAEDGAYEIEDDDDIAQLYPQIALFLYDENGELLFGRRERFVCALREGDIWQWDDGEGVVYLALDQPLTLNGRQIFVRGVTERRYASVGVAPLRLISWLLLPLLVAFAGIGGYILTKRAFMPVARMSEAARRITVSRDFSLRVGGGEKHDELGALAVTIDGMLAELEKAYEAERRLTADASHELRTPLAGILLQCEDALASGDADSMREALSQIHRASRDMSSLLTKLLLLAKMDCSAQVMEKERIDMGELADMCVEQIRQSAPAGMTFHAEISPDLWIWGDQSLLIRLMMNLLENASRYGGENGHVSVTARASEGRVVFSVADDGPGIPEDALAHVFDRFYRADGSRFGKGTGLGLALVASIAKLHGGRAVAESVPGIRTEFRVEFPSA